MDNPEMKVLDFVLSDNDTLPSKEEVDNFMGNPESSKLLDRLVHGLGSKEDQRMAVFLLVGVLNQLSSLQQLQMLVEAVGMSRDGIGPLPSIINPEKKH